MKPIIGAFGTGRISAYEALEIVKQSNLLLDLGKAVEKWLDDGHIMECSGVEIWSKEELIEWYKGGNNERTY